MSYLKSYTMAHRPNREKSTVAAINQSAAVVADAKATSQAKKVMAAATVRERVESSRGRTGGMWHHSVVRAKSRFQSFQEGTYDRMPADGMLKIQIHGRPKNQGICHRQSRHRQGPLTYPEEKNSYRCSCRCQSWHLSKRSNFRAC